MKYLRHWRYLRNEAEPLRQASLLLALSGAVGRGDSLLTTLDALAADCSGQWGNCLRQLHSLVESGNSLSEALSVIDDFMPESTIAAIGVAEESHCLAAVLTDEARRLTSSLGSESSVRPGLDLLVVWLAASGTVVTSVLLFLIVYIVPKLKVIFTEFGVELPGATSTTFAMLDTFADWLPLMILPGLGTVGAGCWFTLRACRRKLVHGSWPWLDQRARYRLPELLRLLSLSIATGGSVTACVEKMLYSCPPGQVSDRLLRLQTLLESGEALIPAMQSAKLIHSAEAALLKTAETARNTDWALRKLADELDRKSLRFRDRVLLLAEPVAMILTGLAVLQLATAFWAPLIKLITDLS